MADLISLVSSVFGMELIALGETSITIGLVTAGSLVFGLAVSVFKRVRGR